MTHEKGNDGNETRLFVNNIYDHKREFSWLRPFRKDPDLGRKSISRVWSGEAEEKKRDHKTVTTIPMQIIKYLIICVDKVW